MSDGLNAFGLNVLGLELAIQCALWVESQHPGCCCFALDCGIDSVHSYQRNNHRVKCSNCTNLALPGRGKCNTCLEVQRKANKRWYMKRRSNGLQSQI